jgi:hypothetical protein
MMKRLVQSLMAQRSLAMFVMYLINRHIGFDDSLSIVNPIPCMLR